MKNKVLIVEDNTIFAVNLFNYLKSNNNLIDIIGIASDGKEALGIFEEKKTDIVILDLKIPIINGVELLKIFNSKNITVILMSGEIKMINDINIFDFQIVKQVYIKPFEFDRLNEDLISIIEDDYSQEMKENIENELKYFNFNKNSKGYRYLIQCLENCYTEPKLLYNMEKDLFFKVSQENHLQNSNIIKWSIQKSIVSMERYTDTNTILKYFPYSKNPTSKMFISTLSEIIIKKYKKYIYLK